MNAEQAALVDALAGALSLGAPTAATVCHILRAADADRPALLDTADKDTLTLYKALRRCESRLHRASVVGNMYAAGVQPQDAATRRVFHRLDVAQREVEQCHPDVPAVVQRALAAADARWKQRHHQPCPDGYPYHAPWQELTRGQHFKPCGPSAPSSFMFSFAGFICARHRPFDGSNPCVGCVTHAERLHAVGVGFRMKLVGLLLRAQALVRWDTKRLVHHICTMRRVNSGQAVALRDAVYARARDLCEAGVFPDAVAPLELAVLWLDFRAYALLAQLLFDGRMGLHTSVINQARARELALFGCTMGCPDCTGMHAWFLYYNGRSGVATADDAADCVRLSTISNNRGSRYGQYVLALLCEQGTVGLPKDRVESLALLRLSAAQGYDHAQHSLGMAYYYGTGVARCYDTAMRWLLLAASQGRSQALYRIAKLYATNRCGNQSWSAAETYYRRAYEIDRFDGNVPTLYRDMSWFKQYSER